MVDFPYSHVNRFAAAAAAVFGCCSYSFDWPPQSSLMHVASSSASVRLQFHNCVLYPWAGSRWTWRQRVGVMAP